MEVTEAAERLGVARTTLSRVEQQQPKAAKARRLEIPEDRGVFRLPSLTERLTLYAALTALTSLSIDALLPALRQIGAALAPSPILSTQHLVSLFILGMAIGELAIGPLSDAWGRKRALLIGLAVYGVGTVLAGLAGSLELMVLGRILQGVGVAGPKIATRAMIRDQFAGDQMARILSFMFTLFILVPMLAPILAQGLTRLAGWRSLFLAYLVVATGLGLWLSLRHPETLSPAARIPIRPSLLIANGRRILSHRQVVLLIVATGLVFSAQLLYLSIAADLFFDLYDIETGFPLLFAVLALSLGLASFVNAGWVRWVGAAWIARRALLGLSTAGLTLVAASAAFDGRPPLWLFLVIGLAGFFAIGLLFGNLNALAMRPLGRLAGFGASVIASGSSLIASCLAVGIGALYDGSATALALGFILAGMGGLGLFEAALRSEATEIDPIGSADHRR
ncbi:MFS transporter [Rhizobium sp. YIM 134829]|uniref:MFS transporter n=1 Tax=Rhizobium sp. YIM 134829 TaxID=3390453 RepID=UPI0039793F61